MASQNRPARWPSGRKQGQKERSGRHCPSCRTGIQPLEPHPCSSRTSGRPGCSKDTGTSPPPPGTRDGDVDIRPLQEKYRCEAHVSPDRPRAVRRPPQVFAPCRDSGGPGNRPHRFSRSALRRRTGRARAGEYGGNRSTSRCPPSQRSARLRRRADQRRVDGQAAGRYLAPGDRV